MEVWWSGLLPQPEHDKDPRLEQLVALRAQLAEANRVVASLTPRSAEKGTCSGGGWDASRQECRRGGGGSAAQVSQGRLLVIRAEENAGVLGASGGVCWWLKLIVGMRPPLLLLLL